mmetsp:Transcript_31217/g.46462  ORF Transcript_31217/g.46462 Transcript_31217/m.46462 type:complete len:88 (-) Transcript_31217:8-271(-)
MRPRGGERHAGRRLLRSLVKSVWVSFFIRRPSCTASAIRATALVAPVDGSVGWVAEKAASPNKKEANFLQSCIRPGNITSDSSRPED